jgi:uncharacterized membrane protein YphA (DoxX/SURF4 family)
MPMISGVRQWAFVGLRMLLGAVFVWAGAVKIADPQGFAAIVGNYQILPGVLVGPAAVLLPWVEVLCGLLLLAGLWVDGSLLVVNVLMVVFMAALVSIWIRGIDVDCGCFSVLTTERRSAYVTDMVRDAGLLAIGAWLALQRLGAGRP